MSGFMRPAPFDPSLLPLRGSIDCVAIGSLSARYPSGELQLRSIAEHWLQNQDAPNGIRTRATALKGPRPGPLVDGGRELRLPRATATAAAPEQPAKPEPYEREDEECGEARTVRRQPCGERDQHADAPENPDHSGARDDRCVSHRPNRRLQRLAERLRIDPSSRCRKVVQGRAELRSTA